MHGSYYLLNFSEPSLPTETNISSTGQEIPCKLWNPNVLYHFHNSPPRYLILNNWIQTTLSHPV